MILGHCHVVITDQADGAHIFQGAGCLSARCLLVTFLGKVIVLSFPGSLQVLVPNL
jgi:hypothetical protein